MAVIRFSIFLMLLVAASVWLAPSATCGRPIARTATEECSITRPDGHKEPGVKNDKGECCSAFYADDCIPPTPQQNGAAFYGSYKPEAMSPLIPLGRQTSTYGNGL
jgi:hypothetical protein